MTSNPNHLLYAPLKGAQEFVNRMYNQYTKLVNDSDDQRPVISRPAMSSYHSGGSSGGAGGSATSARSNSSAPPPLSGRIREILRRRGSDVPNSLKIDQTPPKNPYSERSPLMDSPALCSIRYSQGSSSDTSSIRSSASTVVWQQNNCSESADDYDATTTTQNDEEAGPEVRSLEAEVDGVKGMVGRIMKKIINRGGHIEHLRNRAAGLGDVSSMFRRRGGEIEMESWIETYKLKGLCSILFVTVVLCVIGLLLLIFLALIGRLLYQAPRPVTPPPSPPPPSQPQYPYPPYPYPYPPYPPYCQPYPGPAPPAPGPSPPPAPAPAPPPPANPTPPK